MTRKIIKKFLYIIAICKGKLKYFFIRPYYLVRSSWFFWFYIINREGRKMYKLFPPFLNEVQKRITNDLKKDGYALAHFDELFPGNGYWDKLQAYINEKISKDDVEIKKGKSFLVELWEAVPVLDFNHPFVRLGLNEEVLKVVNSYLDMWSKLSLLSLHMTIPVTDKDSPVKSQRWHRDPEDKIMCKMFVYLNDVDENAGPFMYVAGSHYGGLWRGLAPQRPPKGYYPPLGLVENKVPLKDIKTFTGKAGTVIFCDTSGLHKGGYAKSGRRIMFTAGYNSKASLKPVLYRYSEKLETELVNLSPVVKYAVKNKRFQVL